MENQQGKGAAGAAFGLLLQQACVGIVPLHEYLVTLLDESFGGFEVSLLGLLDGLDVGAAGSAHGGNDVECYQF